MRVLQHDPLEVTRMYLLSALLSIAIIGVAIFTFGSSNGQIHPPAEFSNAYNQDLTVPLPGTLLPIGEIRKLAAKEAPGKRITEIKLQSKQKKLIYVVKLAEDGHLIFDAMTGEKLSSDLVSPSSKSNETIPEGFNPVIDFDGAREIALAQIPEGIISKIELMKGGSDIIYNVEFVDGSSVEISAADGSVMEGSGTQWQETGTPETKPTEETTPPPTDTTEPPSDTTAPPPAEEPAAEPISF